MHIVKEGKKKTISPTMVEVTSFIFLLNSQTLGVLVLINSSDHICIVDIRNIDVINWCILDNVRGRRLACSVFKSSLVWFFGPKMGNQQPQLQFWLLILGTTELLQYNYNIYI